MEAAASPPDPGVGTGDVNLGYMFFFLSFFIPFLLSFLFYSYFFFLNLMDKSFYLKITFIQRVILPNYGVIILSPFDLSKQPLIIRNFNCIFGKSYFL